MPLASAAGADGGRGVSAPPSAPHPTVSPHRHKQEAAEEQEEKGSAAERLSGKLAGAGGPERR